MASRKELVKVSYQDLKIYQRHYKEILKLVNTSFGKIIYLSCTSQLIWGLICLTIGILTLVRNCDSSGIRIGIWSGVIYLFCGIVGLVAAGNVSYTNVMCYLIASMMALFIAVTALFLGGRQLHQIIFDNITTECTVYPAMLLCFSFVEAITAVTATIIAFQLGKGPVTPSLLPGL
ncbi:uncharacterized protein LOC117120124 [Anneissia japonica]|uniref:uncharacterized protein LOC117120124 n=1 Tax=Anneissia japonica TaxID=1529436 RepID=UPI001425B118|nr:uncharacterized protein LOC117120124 [Anneissia japonica]